MANLSKMSESQLNKILKETQAELARRVKVSKATQAVAKILQEHDLTSDDINLKKLALAGSNPAKNKANSKSSNQKRTRPKVAPKFKSLDDDQKWTGRGRAPRWVVAFCEAENLSIEGFKKDPRFKI